jgi:hypothetical protein
MKKAISFVSLFLAMQVFISCSDLTSKPDSTFEAKEDVKIVKINNEYEMSVPDYMKEAKELNDEASLQYQNLFKETYVVIIDEYKDTILERLKEIGEYNADSSAIKNYRDTQLSLIGERANIKGPTPAVAMKINGLNAEFVEFRAGVEGVPDDIAYFVTFIESKEKFYMVMAWTLYERRDKYRDDFLNMFNSFRIIKNRRPRSEPGA